MNVINFKIYKNKAYLAVIVAALGYFVDAFDLLLFSVVRKASLESIGLKGDEVTTIGIFLLNVQLAGMLIGGLLWGILGDRLGRIQVLFGSILLYSLANIGNAFVTDVTSYTIMRFISGVGLAGEIGAGITLVSELLPKETRGIATALVAGVGVLGGATASLTAKFFSWQSAYLIGGIMGLVLLAMRISVVESGMFAKLKDNKDVKKGSLKLLLGNAGRIKKYLASIFIGAPIWITVGVVATFSPEITKDLGLANPISAADSMLIITIFAALGDFSTGLLCQFLKSRKKVIGLGLGISLISLTFLLTLKNPSNSLIVYVLYAISGYSLGYWATLITCAAEQFGTNIRATVATSVPNFVRALAIPITFSFQALRGNIGAASATLVISWVCCGIAFVALYILEETFGKELNYIESDQEIKIDKEVANL